MLKFSFKTCGARVIALMGQPTQVNMMSTSHSLKTSMLRLLNDRGGNFAMLTAIALPVLIGSASVAVDFSNMVVQKQQLQEATDSAALAAASALASGKAANEDAAKELAKSFVAGQMANYVDQATADAIKDSLSVDIHTTTTSGGKSYKITMGGSSEIGATPLARIFGYDKFQVAAASTTTSGISEERSAISMTLVLDESGSMKADTGTLDPTQTSCVKYDASGTQIIDKSGKTPVTKFSPCYIKKIDALKAAANLLLDEIDKADPSKPAKYSRTNAIAWNDAVRLSSNFAWGTSNTRSQVINVLSAGSGTESYAPMKQAHNGLKDTAKNPEATTQTNAGNTKLTKYIVFMTDGDNNATSSDTNTRTECSDAKTKDNIKIYSIAFMAPTRGQQLLQDCSSGTGFYFKAESMSDLLSAFQKIGQDASANKTLLTQ
jgi:Flp pilus assembly protein TadG